MGFTHFNSISVTGTGGFAVGSATAGETRIIDSDGNIACAGTLTGSAGVSYDTYQGVMCWQVTDGTTIWSVAPYSCNIEGYVSLSVSSGTGRIVSIVHGSAGDNAISMTAQGASGTIGAVKTMTASAVPSLTDGEVFRIVMATCATAQICGVTINLTKT